MDNREPNLTFEFQDKHERHIQTETVFLEEKFLNRFKEFSKQNNIPLPQAISHILQFSFYKTYPCKAPDWLVELLAIFVPTVTINIILVVLLCT